MQHPPPGWPGAQYPPNPMMPGSMMMMPPMMGAVPPMGRMFLLFFYLKKFNHLIVVYFLHFMDFSSERFYEGRNNIKTRDVSKMYMYYFIFSRQMIIMAIQRLKKRKLYGLSIKDLRDERIITIQYRENLVGRNQMS